ncbi:MAG: Imm52 family immunity protein [Bacteroidota bacterium]
MSNNKEILKYVSALWGDENTTAIECGERIYDFMMLIKEHNKGLFGVWYEQGMSLKEALDKKIDVSQEYFYRQVERNWDKKFPALGSRVALWTGQKEDGYSAVISFNLGKHTNNPNLLNSCVVNLPYKGQYAESYKEPANRIALMRLMQAFWKPDFLKVNGKRIEEIV